MRLLPGMAGRGGGNGQPRSHAGVDLGFALLWKLPAHPLAKELDPEIVQVERFAHALSLHTHVPNGTALVPQIPG